MGMIRTQNMVPEVYVNGSRDFEMLCNLFDSLLNTNKYFIDSLLNVTDTAYINTELLPLLSTKLGFESKKTFNDKELRYILQALPYLIRGKGSLGAVKKLIDACLKLYNVNAQYEISVTTEATVIGKISLDAHTLVIGIESILNSTELIKEVGKYILPTGFSLYIYFYQGMSLTNYVAYQDCLELLFVSDNINSQLIAHNRVVSERRENGQDIISIPMRVDLDTFEDIEKYKVKKPGAPTETISIFTPNFYIRYYYNEFIFTYENTSLEMKTVPIEASTQEEAEEKFYLRCTDVLRVQSIVRNQGEVVVPKEYSTSEELARTWFSTNYPDAFISQIRRDDTLGQDLLGSVGSMWVYSENLSPTVSYKGDTITSGMFRGIVDSTSSVDNPKTNDVCVSCKVDGEYKSYQTYLYLNDSWHELNFMGTYDSLLTINSDSLIPYTSVVAVAKKTLLQFKSNQWEDVSSQYQGKFDSKESASAKVGNGIIQLKANDRYYKISSSSWTDLINRGEYFTLSELNLVSPTEKRYEVVDASGSTYAQFETEQEAQEYMENHPDKSFGDMIKNSDNVASIYGARYYLWTGSIWTECTYPMYNMKSYFVEGRREEEDE